MSKSSKKISSIHNDQREASDYIDTVSDNGDIDTDNHHVVN